MACGIKPTLAKGARNAGVLKFGDPGSTLEIRDCAAWEADRCSSCIWLVASTSEGVFKTFGVSGEPNFNLRISLKVDLEATKNVILQGWSFGAQASGYATGPSGPAP